MCQFPRTFALMLLLRETWKRGLNLATGVRDVGPKGALVMIGTGAHVLDVREPGEWARGIIAGSVLMRLSEVEKRQAEIAHLRHQQLIVICHGGKRSATACRILARLGFSGQFNLAGGILAWRSAGFATERPLAEAPQATRLATNQ